MRVEKKLCFDYVVWCGWLASSLTPLGPQSRFGDKLLIFRVVCPHIWEWGSKRVNLHVCNETSSKRSHVEDNRFIYVIHNIFASPFLSHNCCDIIRSPKISSARSRYNPSSMCGSWLAKLTRDYPMYDKMRPSPWHLLCRSSDFSSSLHPDPWRLSTLRTQGRKLQPNLRPHSHTGVDGRTLCM